MSLEQWLDPCNALRPVPGYNRRCIQQDALPILQLRILALEHVTVVVTDSPALMEFPEFRAARWSAAEKSESAEEIRIKLLDAEGGASLRAEVDAYNLELEARRLEEQDEIEKRKKKRAEKKKERERAKVTKERVVPVTREVINHHLEQQIGGTAKRSWMT